MKKMKYRVRSLQLCPELHFILRLELASGNKLTEPPMVADWPKKGSVFAALDRDATINENTLPNSVSHHICNDAHYGWNDEFFCNIHKDLLVAGVTKIPEKQSLARQVLIIPYPINTLNFGMIGLCLSPNYHQ